ncbi:MAG: hypothetical protein IPL63_08845 [Saprospiraceae bacterium]|nr:hypothetical protein [Saprospiraceae bacterium]
MVDLETIGYHLRVNIDLKWLRPIKENIVISDKQDIKNVRTIKNPISTCDLSAAKPYEIF